MEGGRPQTSPGVLLALGVSPRLSVRPSDCPNRIPQGDVCARLRGSLAKGDPNIDIPASRGGCPLPVTSSEGRLPAYGRAPECVNGIVLASGQLPTDSISARPADKQPAGLQVFLSASQEGQPSERRRPIAPAESEPGATVDLGRDSAMAVSSHQRPIKWQCRHGRFGGGGTKADCTSLNLGVGLTCWAS